jgi:choice-of-anchor B domain-containing protein
MGLSWGNGIVEVTDPANPQIVAVIPGGAAGFNSLWRDITVIGTYAYAVSDQSGVGIQVIDLSQIDTGTVTFIRNYSQGGHTTTHTILSNPASGYLYLCGGNAAGGGMVPARTDVDPTFPTFTGPGWTNQYVHEAQILTYPNSGPYANKEIAFLFAAGPYYGSSYTTGLAIVDVTNKAAPVTLSQIPYPGFRFCHQGWVTDDRKYLYVDDELDAPTSGNGNVPRFLSRIFDVSDLSNPRMISVATNGLGSVDHNQYVRGRYLYQSNYTTGFRMWDISNPLKPVEIGFLDTRPEDDGTGYNGAWGNYPYFASGTVLISDLERGLFIVRPSLLELTPQGTPPSLVTPGLGTPVSVQVAARDANIASVQVMVSINGGSYLATALASQGGGLYSGSIPATTCYDRVRYYFKALTDDQTPRSFTWPVAAETGDVLSAYAEVSDSTLFSDNFEADQGWTVSNDAGLTAGAWIRATPLYNGGAGAVIGDGDGSGKCFVTGNTLNADVTGGATRLLSPVLNLASAPEARITYSRWFLSLVGTVDSLVTQVSADNGLNWATVSSVTPATGGWQKTTFRVADYVTPTAQVRVRFTVSNTDSSTTEAGIDGFSVVSPACAVPCYANCDGSSLPPVLNVNDFLCFQNLYASGSSLANCDGSSLPPVLNVNDFLCFQNLYAQGCP